MAYLDDRRALSYRELEEAARRFAGLLGDLGIRREERIVLFMLDTVELPVAFLGALYAASSTPRRALCSSRRRSPGRSLPPSSWRPLEVASRSPWFRTPRQGAPNARCGRGSPRPRLRRGPSTRTPTTSSHAPLLADGLWL
jgi:hypothetical protein